MTKPTKPIAPKTTRTCTALLMAALLATEAGAMELLETLGDTTLAGGRVDKSGTAGEVMATEAEAEAAEDEAEELEVAVDVVTTADVAADETALDVAGVVELPEVLGGTPEPAWMVNCGE